jgi:hypothetical protein
MHEKLNIDLSRTCSMRNTFNTKNTFENILIGINKEERNKK